MLYLLFYNLYYVTLQYAILNALLKLSIIKNNKILQSPKIQL